MASLSNQEVPLEVRERFILTGYRPLGTSFTYGLKSFFLLHNETLNVWTHVAPLLYFFYYLCIDTDLWRRLESIPKTRTSFHYMDTSRESVYYSPLAALLTSAAVLGPEDGEMFVSC